jgi:hypothetical protein
MDRRISVAKKAKVSFVVIVLVMLCCLTFAASAQMIAAAAPTRADDDPYGVEVGDPYRALRFDRREALIRPANGVFTQAFPQRIIEGAATAVNLTARGAAVALSPGGYVYNVTQLNDDIEVLYSQSTIGINKGISGTVSPNEGIFVESTIKNDTAAPMLFSSIYLLRSFYQTRFFDSTGVIYNVDGLHGSFWDQRYYHYMLWEHPIRISLFVQDPAGTEIIGGLRYKEIKLTNANGKEWVFMPEMDVYHEAWYGLTDKTVYDNVTSRQALDNYSKGTFDVTKGGGPLVMMPGDSIIIRWGWYFGYADLTIAPGQSNNTSWAGQNFQHVMGFDSFFGIKFSPYVSDDTGALIVRKVLAGNNTEPAREFTFQVTFSDGKTYDGVASGFTLKGGESKTINGIPYGVGYTVIEVNANQNGYTTTFTGDIGTISADTATAEFINTRNSYGNLIIRKVLAGNNTEPARDFTFRVTFSDNGTYGGVASGGAFTLKGGESKTINGIPYGVAYTVIEVDANQNGYTTTHIGDNGTISATEAIAEFINTRNSYYNYTVYLVPEKTALKAGDTLYVDVMLNGNINYTQMAAEIAYDTALLEFAGYANLQGWAASVTKSATDKIAVRNVPSMNMLAGAPCSPDIRIVTLAFTVKSGFAGESTETDLSFASTLVSPVGGVVGATIAPGKTVSVTLQK